MLIVVALGGNALVRGGEALEAEIQRRNIEAACAVIAGLALEHRVVVTHGNGPQVGLLALQSEAYRDVRSYPLDVLGAESEGMVGYLLQQGLENALPRAKVATLLTQVVVDAHDPAFLEPSKPVGPVYLEEEAAALETARGWAMAPDGAAGWRRVVASPRPHEVVERATIDLLVEAGVLVVCSGGGGIPVVRDEVGRLRGAEAVVDKDRTAALLARQLGADRLLLLTDVDAVYANYGRPGAQAIRRSLPRPAASVRLRRRLDGSEGRSGLELRDLDRQPGAHRPSRRRREAAHGPGGHRDQRRRRLHRLVPVAGSVDRPLILAGHFGHETRDFRP